MKYLLGLLVVILVFLQLRLWRGEGSLADIDRLEAEIGKQSEANKLLEARNDALLQEVSDLKTGLDSVEEHARSKLGLIKKGETYFLIVDKESASAASDGTGTRVATPPLPPAAVPTTP